MESVKATVSRQQREALEQLVEQEMIKIQFNSDKNEDEKTKDEKVLTFAEFEIVEKIENIKKKIVL